MMWQKLLIMASMATALTTNEMTDNMVQHITDYKELNATLENNDCVLFLAIDNCNVCQGIHLHWLARYMYRAGRSLEVVHVTTKANSNLTYYFGLEPPSVLASKNGFLMAYADDITLINVVEWLESIFPVIHEIPTKVWFSDEILRELQDDDLAGSMTLTVIFFTHTTIAKAKLFVHYRQTADVFKGKLRCYFVDIGSSKGMHMAKHMAGQNRIPPQVLYISSEGRATGPIDRLPVNTYIITKWIDNNYQQDIYVKSHWRKGSGLINKLSNLAQLRVNGTTVILFVRGHTRISVEAYNILFEVAKHLKSEVIHFWLLDLSVPRNSLTRQLDVSQYSVGLPFYMSIDSDEDKKVLPHSPPAILIRWLINITTYAEKNESQPSAEKYQPGVVNIYNEKTSLNLIEHGRGFGLLLYTDDCAWCNDIHQIWRYLANQCQQVIFTKAKPSGIMYGSLSDLLLHGNGIYYVKRKKQTDLMISIFTFDKTVTMIKEFITHSGDQKYMETFVANNANIYVDQKPWPEDLHCYTTTRNELTTVEVDSDMLTTISPLLNQPMSQMTPNANNTSLGNQHLAGWLATIYVTMLTICHYI